ncbi:MAG: hypothetical protein SWK76_13965 [Actinomycetota bacterium]|nr:hypothetical protein [Actinomycetota bacterium]
MAIADLPDFENLVTEIPQDVQERGKEIIAKIRENPMSNLFTVMTQLLGDVLEMIPRLGADPEVKKALEVKMQPALGRKIFVEITGIDSGSMGITFTIKELPELLEYGIGPIEGDIFGVRVKFDDILDVLSSVLEEGKIAPVPEILDFYSRGKLTIKSPKDLPAFSDLSPLMGASISLLPKINEIRERVDSKGVMFNAVREIEL